MKKLIFVFIFFLHGFVTATLTEKTTKIQHKDVPSQVHFVLGADITISHVSTGIFAIEEQKPILLLEYKTATDDIQDLYLYMNDILTDLALKHNINSITTACFAIPGILKENGLFLHPHLPWNTSSDPKQHTDTSQKGISKPNLQAITKLENVYFINDFQAAALGTQAIDSSQLKTLQHGKKQPKQIKLVIGAGNGLGASLLLWNDKLSQYIPSQLNYSFTEFGAQTEVELAFFKYMKEKTGNIAWGKVLGAGAGGIKLIYNFFDAYNSAKPTDKQKYKNDPFVEYANYLDVFKHRHTSGRCHDAVQFFVQQYAKIIRNAAYAQAAYGGVYITNTVVQEYPELFTTQEFINQIVDLQDIISHEGSKNYLEGYLKELSFYLVTNKYSLLYGAAILCIQPNLIK